MSVTKELAFPPCSSPKKRKKRHREIAESCASVENDTDSGTRIVKPTKNSNSVAVRLQKRKKDKVIKTDGFDGAILSAKNEDASAGRISVNDNVDSVPVRMKRRKVTQPELVGERTDRSDEPDLKTHHKKVSFNETVHSAPARVKKKKKLKLDPTDVRELPLPKSILKHVEFTNGPDPKKKKKTKKGNKRKLQFKTKNNVQTKTATTPVSKQEKAIAFLETWKNDKAHWKFEKLTQTWLLKNMLDGSKVPEKTFHLLLEYIGSVEGAAKNFATQTCEAAIKNMEQNSLTEGQDDTLMYSYTRARSLLQCLRD